MKEKELYVAWRDPIKHEWLPVGLLTHSYDNEEGVYRFVYTKGALCSSNFIPFANMEDLYAEYVSVDLFPVFQNRILSKFRPEYNNYLVWLNMQDNVYDDLSMLAYSEGLRGTDTLEVFQCPKPNDEGKYEVQFLVHGLRYLEENAIDRINRLEHGEVLYLIRDVLNKNDPYAIALRTDDPPTFIGYCPRYLTGDFNKLIETFKDKPQEIEVFVEKVNRDAPLNLRLICKLICSWPKNFKSCSDEKFKALVNNKWFPAYNDTRKKGGEEMAKRKSNYDFGRSQEHRVANSLRGKGASVKLSRASRGAADLTATFSSGKTWKVQVKSSRSGTPASPSTREIGRLKISASRSGATPVVTKATPKSISHKSARSGKKLNP